MTRTAIIILTCLALAACGQKRTAVELQRVVCPPQPLEVHCPDPPEFPYDVPRENVRPYEAEVKASAATCQRALEAWRLAWEACRP